MGHATGRLETIEVYVFIATSLDVRSKIRNVDAKARAQGLAGETMQNLAIAAGTTA